MDASGARSLSQRIAQHEQWCAAEAVRNGRQAAADPDQNELVAIGDGIRIYGADFAGAGERMCKRLLDGYWLPGVIAEGGENAA